MLQIDVNELMELCTNDIALQDRVKTVKLRIKNNLVDDIDYFTFPKRWLEQNLENKTDEDIKKERRQYI